MENPIFALKNGGLILHKTDTIWGIGCDATNEMAIEKLKSLKGREAEKSFILLIADISQLSVYVENVPDIAWDLVEFAEKPLTVIYPKGKNLPKNAMAADGSVAIRLVKDEKCKQIIYKFGKAVASTSANISGKTTPNKFEDIDAKIINGVDYIEKSIGMDTKNPPSTIVKLGLNGDFSFIRK